MSAPRLRRAVGRLCAAGRTAALACVLATCASAASAQAPSVVWEQLPLFPDREAVAVQFTSWWTGDGTAPPDQDTLLIYSPYGFHRYAPDLPPHIDWGLWRRVCPLSCGSHFREGVVTETGTLFWSRVGTHRSLDRGRTTETVTTMGGYPWMEVTLPWMRQISGGRPVLVFGAGFNGEHVRSLHGGDPGTWEVGGPSSYPETLGEVPPSPSLPLGRLLHGGDRVMYSDDGAMTWRPSRMGADSTSRYRKFSFAFLPREGHPYGGAVIAVGCGEFFWCEWGGGGTGEASTVWRSDDGGTSYHEVHRFSNTLLQLTRVNGAHFIHGTVAVGPDGALWAGVGRRLGPIIHEQVGRIVRSTDEGLTWHRADAGLAQANNGQGWFIYDIRAARDGRLYASTEMGVWRTVEPVVGAEAAAEAPAALAVHVAPNPTTGRVTVTVETGRALASALVDVFDLQGRIVAPLAAGTPLAAGHHRYEVDTAGWAAGIYFARIHAEGRQEIARITVAR